MIGVRGRFSMGLRLGLLDSVSGGSDRRRATRDVRTQLAGRSVAGPGKDGVTFGGSGSAMKLAATTAPARATPAAAKVA